MREAFTRPRVCNQDLRGRSGKGKRGPKTSRYLQVRLLSPAPLSPMPSLRELIDLDEISAGVGEDRDLHRSGRSWRHCENDAELFQATNFRLEVIDFECGRRDVLLEQRRLKCFTRRVRV